MNKKILITLAAGLIGLSTAQSSFVVVDLTGDGWATTNGNLGNSGSVMTATNIQPASGYNGPALLGGAVATNAVIDNWEVFDNGGTNVLAGKDVFQLRSATTVNGDPTKFHHAALFFDQSAFGGGLNNIAGGVTLDATTSLSYTAKRVSGNPSRIGYVIEADGSYFLHQIAYNDNQAGSGAGHVFSLADPTSVTWNSFDPTVSLSTIGSAATPNFTQVTGMGIWFENERTSTSGSGMHMRVGEITLTAVPEPSTYATLVGVLALGLVIRRKRFA